MKRIKLLFFLLLLLPYAAKAQTTAITLQVTDTGGQSWNNGTWSVLLVSLPGADPHGPPFYQLGTSTIIPNQSQSGALSGTGSATMTLTQTIGIAPSSSRWNFTVCSQATATNNCYTQFVVITTSTTVTLTPPALVVNPGPSSLAYVDSEITGAVVGSVYYNIVSNIQRVCNGPSPCTWASNGGGGTSAFGPNFSVGGGVAQFQTVSPTTPITNATLVVGYELCWLPVASNTGAIPTLAGAGTSTFSAIIIAKNGVSANLVANDIVLGTIACVKYDGTSFQLQNPQAGLVASASLTLGGGASAVGSGATGGYGCGEATNTGFTPTVGLLYKRCDNTLKTFVSSLDGAVEIPDPMFSAVPVGGRCVETLGTAGQMVEKSLGCGTGSGTVANCATPDALAIYTAGTTTGCGNADFTYDATAHTLKAGAGGLVDLGAELTGGLILPKVSGNAPNTNGALQFDSSNSSVTFGTTGGPQHLAVASGSSAGTQCGNTNQVLTGVSTNANPTCAALSVYVTSDYTNATTTPSNVTGLAIPLLASQKYAISCKIVYQGSAATASLVLTSTGPASPTKVTAMTLMDTSVGAGAAFYSSATDGTTFGFSLGPTALTTTGADLYATIDIGVRNGVNTGTWQLQASSNGAGTVTIKDGSFCKYQ